MFQKTCVGLAEARAAVEAVLNEACKLPDAPIAVAMVDDYGRLVYFARMDGCPPVVVELAISKAYTAAVALMDTLAFAERDRGWGRELATYGDARFTYLQGGLVIRATSASGEPSTLLGGIGVSGRMPDEDERLARIGLEAMKQD
jgi:glc operon protein GlcG